MEFAYGDIIGLARPTHEGDLFSRRHPKMSRLNRAKLFAPFAALSGLDAAVRAKETPYVPRRMLDAEEAHVLNRALNRLYRAARTGALARQNRVRVRVSYFEVCADPNSSACGRMGLYRTETGIVRKVDPVHRRLWIGDKAVLFDDIDSIAPMR